jgi:hypothetical protein
MFQKICFFCVAPISRGGHITNHLWKWRTFLGLVENINRLLKSIYRGGQCLKPFIEAFYRGILIQSLRKKGDASKNHLCRSPQLVRGLSWGRRKNAVEEGDDKWTPHITLLTSNPCATMKKRCNRPNLVATGRCCNQIVFVANGCKKSHCNKLLQPLLVCRCKCWGFLQP